MNNVAGLRALLIAVAIVITWQFLRIHSELGVIKEEFQSVYENQEEIVKHQLKIFEHLQQAEEASDASGQFFNPKEGKVQIISTKERIKHTDLDVFCLAKNIYHEARGESKIGKYAIAQVTLNRVKHERYHNTICKAVLQRGSFSWTRNKGLHWSHPKGKEWGEAKEVARKFLKEGKRIAGLNNALFYHADYVSPNWAKDEALIARVGTHIFYEDVHHM